MKIVKVARHCCVRVAKEALPLIDRGHDVHVIANRLPHFGGRFGSVQIYQNLTQLENAIMAHPDTDVFHCHNEPSWFVTVVKQVTQKPVVLDVHDSMLIRVAPDDESQTRISVDERNNMQLADGLVFVSRPQARVCRKEFHLDQPYTVLPSYVPREFYRVDSWHWLGGLVYEGRLDLPEEIGKDELPFFKYCEFTKLAEELYKRGVVFNLYTPGGGNPIQKRYGETAVWKGSYEYTKLIRQVGRHDWGLVGNVDEHLAWKYAMPNKLFEYMAAGVPIVAMNALETKRFVEKNGIGIGVDSVDELIERWDEHHRLRKTLLTTRYNWCMDNHIHQVEGLYGKITGQ